jgi:hypothetical protein
VPNIPILSTEVQKAEVLKCQPNEGDMLIEYVGTMAQVGFSKQDDCSRLF